MSNQDKCAYVYTGSERSNLCGQLYMLAGVRCDCPKSLHLPGTSHAFIPPSQADSSQSLGNIEQAESRISSQGTGNAAEHKAAPQADREAKTEPLVTPKNQQGGNAAIAREVVACKHTHTMIFEETECDFIADRIAAALDAKDAEIADLRRLLFAEQKARSEDYATVNQLKSKIANLKAQLSESQNEAEAFSAQMERAIDAKIKTDSKLANLQKFHDEESKRLREQKENLLFNMGDRITELEAQLSEARKTVWEEALWIAETVASTYRIRSEEWTAKGEKERADAQYERSHGADKVKRRIIEKIDSLSQGEASNG